MTALVKPYGFIYRIVRPSTGQVYYGQAVLLDRRRSNHLTQLKKGVHENPWIQAIWDKDPCLVFEPVCAVMSKEELDSIEAGYIEIHRLDGSGLNLRRGGSHGRLAEESKRKISKSLEGNQYRAGIPHTEETKRHLSQVMKKRVVSKETRQRMRSAPNSGRFVTGQIFSEDVKERMSIRSARSRPVLVVDSNGVGYWFHSVAKAAQAFDIGKSTLNAWVRGEYSLPGCQTGNRTNRANDRFIGWDFILLEK